MKRAGVSQETPALCFVGQYLLALPDAGSVDHRQHLLGEIDVFRR